MEIEDSDCSSKSDGSEHRTRIESITETSDCGPIPCVSPSFWNEKTLPLMKIVESRRADLKTGAMDWFDIYNTDCLAGAALLVELLLNAAGSDGRIMPEMLLDPALMLASRPDPVDSKINNKGFARDLCRFFKETVKCVQRPLLMKAHCDVHLLNVMSEMRKNRWWTYRMTAVVIGDVLITDLWFWEAKALAIRDALDKDIALATSEAVMGLRNERDRMSSKIATSQSLSQLVYGIVFKRSFRDVHSKVRAACVLALRKWMEILPEKAISPRFLENLRYALLDEVNIRLVAIETVLFLFSLRSYKDKVKEFAFSIKKHLIQMTSDVSDDVSAVSINAVSRLYSLYSDILTTSDCRLVSELMYSLSRKVAVAAGSFHVQKLRQDGGHWGDAFFRELVYFHKDAKVGQHEDLLMDALLASDEHIIKDWENWTKALGSKGLFRDNSADKPVLARMLSSAVAQIATASIPHLRGTLSAKEKTIMLEKHKVANDKQTEFFLRQMPLLIQKFRTEPDILAPLIAIPRHFNLLFPCCEHVVKRILEEMEMSESSCVVEEAARTVATIIERSAESHGVWSERIAQWNDLVVENIVDHCKWLLHPPSKDDFDSLKVLPELYKVAAISAWQSVAPDSVWDSFYSAIAKCSAMKVKHAQDIVELLCVVCHHILMRAGTDAMVRAKRCIEVPEALQRTLTARAQQFLQQVALLLLSGQDRVTVKQKQQLFLMAYGILALFAPCLATEPALQFLAINVSTSTHFPSAVNRFLKEVVFKREQLKNEEGVSIELMSKYCALIKSGILPLDYFSFPLKNFDSLLFLSPEIKMTLKHLVATDQMTKAIGKLVATVLVELYVEDIQTCDKNTSVPSSRTLGLAHSIAQALGQNPKTDNMLLALHKSALKTALCVRHGERPLILLLYVIAPFAGKLGRKHLDYLVKYIGEEGDIDDRHLQKYMEMLQEDIGRDAVDSTAGSKYDSEEDMLSATVTYVGSQSGVDTPSPGVSTARRSHKETPSPGSSTVRHSRKRAKQTPKYVESLTC